MKTTPIPVKFDRQGHSCNFFAGFGPTVLGFAAMRCLRALLRLGRVGLEGVFCYFGVQSASMRVWGGAMRLFQMLIFRTLIFSVVTGGGAAFCNSCWSSALFVAGGVQCCILAFFLLVAVGQNARRRGAFGFCSILVRCSFGNRLFLRQLVVRIDEFFAYPTILHFVSPPCEGAYGAYCVPRTTHSSKKHPPWGSNPRPQG